MIQGIISSKINTFFDTFFTYGRDSIIVFINNPRFCFGLFIF